MSNTIISNIKIIQSNMEHGESRWRQWHKEEEQTRAFDFVANEYRLRVVVPEEMVPMMVAKCGTAPEMEEIENEEK